MPRVSVLVNTYNHERFIAQAIQSVLNQDFPADQMEIIVVDDGSTDSTPHILQRFLPRIRYIRKENGGQVSAVNAAVAEARGEIFSFLDGDDYWAPHKLSAVVAAFDKNPDVACVGHAYHEVDEHGAILCTMTPTIDRMSLQNRRVAQLSASQRVFLGTSRLAMCRPAVAKALPIPPELPFFDNFISTQGVAISGAVLLHEPLCYYRLHADNLYASKTRDNRLLERKYRLLTALLAHLPERLASFGITDDLIDAFLGADRLEAEQLRLSLFGGKRFDTLRVERACFNLAYRDADASYRVFKSLVFLLAIVLPPRAFYRVRDWYADHNLNSARQRIGGATLVVPKVTATRDLGGKTPHSSVRV